MKPRNADTKKSRATVIAKAQLPAGNFVEELHALETDEFYEGLAISDASYDESNASFLRIESSIFKRVLFRHSELAGLKLSDLRFEACDFSNSIWKKCTMNRVEFVGCRMTGMQTPESRLSNVLFSDCKCDLMQLSLSKINSARFEKCQLSEADFQQSQLEAVAFCQCSFPGAEFYKCSFSDTDFRTSRLEGIKMHTQDWRGATIDSQQLSELASALAASWGLKIDDSPV